MFIHLHALLAPGVPYPHVRVHGGCRNIVRVRMEIKRRDSRVVHTIEDAQGFHGGDVPQAEAATDGPGRHSMAVTVSTHGRDRARVPFETSYSRPCVDLVKMDICVNRSENNRRRPSPVCESQ